VLALRDALELLDCGVLRFERIRRRFGAWCGGKTEIGLQRVAARMLAKCAMTLAINSRAIRGEMGHQLSRSTRCLHCQMNYTPKVGGVSNVWGAAEVTGHFKRANALLNAD
jgi:hypothetical protein